MKEIRIEEGAGLCRGGQICLRVPTLAVSLDLGQVAGTPGPWLT